MYRGLIAVVERRWDLKHLAANYLCKNCSLGLLCSDLECISCGMSQEETSCLPGELIMQDLPIQVGNRLKVGDDSG